MRPHDTQLNFFGNPAGFLKLASVLVFLLHMAVDLSEGLKVASVSLSQNLEKQFFSLKNYGVNKYR